MTTISQLRQVPLFAKLPDERLQWLLDVSKEVWVAPGEIHRHEGDRADHVFVLLEGQVRVTQKFAHQEVLLAIYDAKTLYGELPVLMGKECFWASGRAVTRSQILELPNAAFWEMLSSCNCVMTTILQTMAQRLQVVESISQQREKLVALGTLAAGLAHELNNPASASRRAAGQLRETVLLLQPLTIKLNQQQMTCNQKAFLAELQTDAITRAKNAPKLEPLLESDRADEITAWLEEHDIANTWKLAPTLVTAGLDINWLENIQEKVGKLLLGDILSWIGVTLQEMELLDEIEHCTDRISTLVEAVKDYSYMDQAPQQEIDIHNGLESTLTMLTNKIKHSNVVIKREYGCDIPRLCAYGSELNQVWTNLIDNAIDALTESMGYDIWGVGESPTPCIWIRTSCESDFLLVEIADNGSGIPSDILSHIFEPFFTTKGVGAGTGLGLHIAYRIVVGQHQGDIRVISQPGDTRFQVRLPLKLE